VFSKVTNERLGCTLQDASLEILSIQPVPEMLERLPSKVFGRQRLGVALSLLFAGTTAGVIFAGAEHFVALRIVDAKTGKPIKKVSARMVKWNERGQIEMLSEGKTNAEGIIVFRLFEPLPERVGFDFAPDELKYCSDLAFSIAEIMNVGLLAHNNCQTDTTISPLRRKPGEITLFAQKVSLGERVRKELP
jgi:hypothetical protein